MKIEITGWGIVKFFASAALGGMLTALVGYYTYVVPQHAKYESDVRSAIINDFSSEGMQGFSPQSRLIIEQTHVWDLLSQVGSDYQRAQAAAYEINGLLGNCQGQLMAARQQSGQPAAAVGDTTGYALLNAIRPGLGTVVQRLQQAGVH